MPDAWVAAARATQASADKQVRAQWNDGKIVASSEREMTWVPASGPSTLVAQAKPSEQIAAVQPADAGVLYQVVEGRALNSPSRWEYWDRAQRTSTQIVRIEASENQPQPLLFSAVPLVTPEAIYFNALKDNTLSSFAFDLASQTTKKVKSEVTDGMIAWKGRPLGRGLRGSTSNPSYYFYDLSSAAEVDIPELRPLLNLRFLSSEGDWVVGAYEKTVGWANSATGASGEYSVTEPADLNEAPAITEGYAMVTSNLAVPYLIDLTTGVQSRLVSGGEKYADAYASHGFLTVAETTGKGLFGQTWTVDVRKLPRPAGC